MNGPSEFHVVGTIRDWDITPRLDQIQAPTLVISGEFDEATSAVVTPLVDAIADVRWELFDGASHFSAPHPRIACGVCTSATPRAGRLPRASRGQSHPSTSAAWRTSAAHRSRR
jgi:hypothetical protein